MEHGSNSNIMYTINCSSCDASYVGQTERQLQTKLTDYQRFYQTYKRQSDVNWHRNDLGHDFQWDKVEILDKEQFYHKRLISEILHIKTQKAGVTLMKDAELLDAIYTPVLKKLY